MANEESTTLQNILAAGKEEFLEKGFKSASLRNIVKTAGVTTGAFYGYFSGKEALFAALVEEHATAIMNIFMSAQEDFEMLDEKDKATLEQLEKEHPEYIVKKELHEGKGEVVDSSTRRGVCLMHADAFEKLKPYLPD